MERAEYIEWCKVRAREYMDTGDLTNAVASIASDMDKREDTKVPAAIIMFGMMAVSNYDRDGVKRFIEGFN